MNQADNKAPNRLSVTELTLALGNISKSYRQGNMNPSQFYEYKQRYQAVGLEGLKDLPAIQKSHPRATPAPIINAILELSLAHPFWGCIRLSEALKTKEIYISSPTIQNVLIKFGMGNKYERLQKLEEKAFTDLQQLTAEQITAIEKGNPCFRERFSRSSHPGELLGQDTIYVGYLDGLGKVYLQAVIDTYNNYAFGFIHSGKLPDCAVAILHNDVLPFYRGNDLTIKTILTDNGKEYCGREKHHYELYLLLNDIEHRTTEVHQSAGNGFVKRFRQICFNEFFKQTFKDKFYQSTETLQSDFSQWLQYYNTQRPHYGFPNMGKSPRECFE